MAVHLRVPERRRLRVRGLVQGVGFRPFAYRLALRHGLRGLVRNDSAGVSIEVEGDGTALDAFEADLRRSAPPAARILDLASEAIPPVGDPSFRIDKSVAATRPDPAVSPDLATCPDCLGETLGLRDRRRNYAFTSCSHCGPRFTMQGSVPYDRDRTSMAEFPPCARCRAEYDDPDDRRHHAEGTACPDCGPRLRLLSRDGQEIETNVPIREAAGRLRLGQIVAVKGLGGFHLACLARSEEAVLTLRIRKGRDEKPFAVMVRDLAAARQLCDVGDAEEALLSSPERPIVLLRRRADAPLAGAVAPGNPLLGVMLPYTPLHHLLLRELDGAPLVFTSGNLSDLPIAVEDADALRGPADAVLTHDRSIRSRSDDSVARVVAGEVLVLRRSRGYSPAPVLLPIDVPKNTLALGGALKATFALGRGKEAILSHHLGDLEAYEAYRAYETSIDHYEKLFQFRPETIVHDLHPDYPSTAYALARAAKDGLERRAVQHHHAHMASCMAENGLEGPVIGVAFDGSGYGSDGAIWGGEFLIGDYRSVRRAGHFEYVPMPGGEAAIREPWRMAAAYLVQAGEDLAALRTRIPERSLDVVLQLLRRNVNTPRTSSCGRLFDGVASLLGIRDRVSYEGQAAIELEWLARTSDADGTYPLEIGPGGLLRMSPIVSGVLGDLRGGVRAADIARRFHRTLAEAIRTMGVALRDESGLDRVALSGGVFMNELLLEDSLTRLQREGFRVYRHRRVPPNDGGLALGQLAVVAAGGGR